MKIRLDHVTNSSSSGYIVSLYKGGGESFKEYLSELNNNEDSEAEAEIYFIVDTIEELNEYVNDGPLDWAQKPTGPRFTNMSKEHYKLCREIIEEGGTVAECWIDHNVADKFCKDYEDYIVENYM